MSLPGGLSQPVRGTPNPDSMPPSHDIPGTRGPALRHLHVSARATRSCCPEGSEKNTGARPFLCLSSGALGCGFLSLRLKFTTRKVTLDGEQPAPHLPPEHLLSPQNPRSHHVDDPRLPPPDPGHGSPFHWYGFPCSARFLSVQLRWEPCVSLLTERRVLRVCPRGSSSPLHSLSGVAEATVCMSSRSWLSVCPLTDSWLVSSGRHRERGCGQWVTRIC